jgi:hypothetical protein
MEVFASPVYARPRLVEAFDATVRVPRDATEGVTVTVSPITKPFVLATVKFTGFVDVAPVVTFPATVAFEMRVPAGIAVYGYGEIANDVFVTTETTLYVPNPDIVTGKLAPENVDVFAKGIVRDAPAVKLAAVEYTF